MFQGPFIMLESYLNLMMMMIMLVMMMMLFVESKIPWLSHGWRPPCGGERAQRDTAPKVIVIDFAEIQNWGRYQTGQPGPISENQAQWLRLQFCPVAVGVTEWNECSRPNHLF